MSVTPLSSTQATPSLARFKGMIGLANDISAAAQAGRLEEVATKAKALISQGHTLIAQAVLEGEHATPIPIAEILGETLSSSILQHELPIKEVLSRGVRLFSELTLMKTTASRVPIYEDTHSALQAHIEKARSNLPADHASCRFDLECALQAVCHTRSTDSAMTGSLLSLVRAAVTRDFDMARSAITQINSHRGKEWFYSAQMISWVGVLAIDYPELLSCIEEEIKTYAKSTKVHMAAVQAYGSLLEASPSQAALERLVHYAGLKQRRTQLWEVRLIAVKHVAIATTSSDPALREKATEALFDRRVHESNKVVKALLVEIEKSPEMSHQWKALWSLKQARIVEYQSQEKQEIDAEKRTLENERNRLRKETRQVTRNLTLEASKNQSLKAELQVKTEDLAYAQENVQELETSLAQLKKELGFLVELATTNTSAREELVNKKAKLKEAEEELAEEREQVEQTEQELQTLQATHERQSRQLKNLQAKNKQIDKANQEYRERCQYLEERESECAILSQSIEQLHALSKGLINEILDASGPLNTVVLEKLSAIPERFVCTITGCIMQDPVTAEDGQVYEREAMTRWVSEHGKSPLTNEEIGDGCVPNRTISRQIERFLREHPEHRGEGGGEKKKAAYEKQLEQERKALELEKKRQQAELERGWKELEEERMRLEKQKLEAKKKERQKAEEKRKSAEEASLVVSVSSTTILPKIAFGEAEWEKHFGEIGEEPPLPANIGAILQSECPFWPGKRVEETHMLTLIPKRVHGKPLNLKSLGELVQTPKIGPASGYRYFDLGEYTDLPVSESHWVLMTKDVLPGGVRSYKDLCNQVEEQSQKAGVLYEEPYALETAVSIFMEHVRGGTRVYGDNPWTFTVCQEQYDEDWSLAVSGVSAGGLCVNSNVRIFFDSGGYGIRCRRKF